MSSDDPQNEKEQLRRASSHGDEQRWFELMEQLTKRITGNEEEVRKSEEAARKKMDFILEQQAQITVNQQKADERLAQTDERLTKLEDVVLRFANMTIDRFDKTGEKISALIDSQIRTEEAIKDLTAVVGRYFSEGRNGGS